jgi:hypothetical protein
MSKKKSPFAERFKKIDGGKSSVIASAWEDIIEKKRDIEDTKLISRSSATQTEEMIKISLWVPKEIKNDIDQFITSLKTNPLSRPFAKPSVIIRESLEIGYPKIKEKIMDILK